MLNYKYLAIVISINIWADIAMVDNWIRKWVKHSAKIHTLRELLGSYSYLFLLLASISNNI